MTWKQNGISLLKYYSVIFFLLFFKDFISFFVNSKKFAIFKCRAIGRLVNKILLARNEHVVDIFTSDNMENILLCIFQFLTACVLYNKLIYVLVIHQCNQIFRGLDRKASDKYSTIAVNPNIANYWYVSIIQSYVFACIDECTCYSHLTWKKVLKIIVALCIHAVCNNKR